MTIRQTSLSSLSASRPRLAIPLGDPAGIGPEVILKALRARDWSAIAAITVLGTRSLLHQALGALQQSLYAGPLPNLDSLDFVDIAPPLSLETVTFGQASAATGAASFAYLQAAIEGAVAGQYDAIVTGPIAKSAWKAAGHHYPGQTELLAEGAGCDRFGMAFVAQSPHTGWWLRALLATTHIPLRQVPEVLTPALLTQKLDLLVHSLKQDFGLTQPRIAVAGLNPHSGEGGQLGREEVDWLIPWLEVQRQRYPQVQLDGPIPPDTMWVRPGQAWFGTEGRALETAHDAYLALYHDQGLIPVKLMAFDRAVNTTVGLPFVRTSPDHGTAFDIAGQGIADANSMVAAMEVAVAVMNSRR
ncbi:4-hydroxythreonine-4-phosphate dehydrogenase PdxA [Phormidium tenue]|uniref:4-hydroxythreonine-4-phosphate dehydrogenase n=1 Tax=Phormidium tenue NIES-30 TaxID=549789 RepID=A0A1U7IZ71_9CYAN|nr:4-hydroxythreonine-4-phosphate dehydrogenase PdxA [Phormidium tenue]MBD2234654.1 4-hydroxythreonine-4-phosphate dehydrogenase PdxA [Phormidium tenue FACHB-1052]OKH44120.1 4-hydroxythreonine-4-phosphate dehydrogenase PdxA [Phormidium tenue NIES-30]